MDKNNAASRAGLSLERLSRLNKAMESYVESGEVSGVNTLVYRRGEIVHRAVTGWSDREAQLPMRENAIFRIFSMTKPILAVTALSLVEETRLRLDEPLDHWLPELANRQVLSNPDGPLDGETYPSPRPLTLRDLLTYQSGIGWLGEGREPYEMAALQLSPYPVSILWTGQDLPLSFPPLGPDEWLKQFINLPLKYAPGERWLYHVSSEILGVLLARVSGQSLGDLLKQRIFEPLGMQDTGFWVPQEKLDRLAVGYGTSFKTNEITLVDHPNKSVWAKPPIFESGGGGLVSTIDDYLQFGRMMLNGGILNGARILSPRTIEAMTTDYLSPEQHTHTFAGRPNSWKYLGFGLGVSVVTKLGRLGSNVGSYGWGGAMGTLWANDPKEEMISLLMIQRANHLSNNIRDDFTTLVNQAIVD